jgi:hypothetical protein
MDGQLGKRFAPPLYKGSAWSVEIESLTDLATLLDELPSRQALALCNARRSKANIEAEGVADLSRGTIARTKMHFPWDPNAPALMLFDVDTADYTPQQVLEIILALDPVFNTAASVGRYSTSSFINGPDGFTTGARGVQHLPTSHPPRLDAEGRCNSGEAALA